MKRVLYIIPLALLISCGGASEEQTKAAKEMCDCMNADAFGDFDINYYECEIQLQGNHAPEVFADEGWSEALEAECPEVASKITENE